MADELPDNEVAFELGGLWIVPPKCNMRKPDGIPIVALMAFTTNYAAEEFRERHPTAGELIGRMITKGTVTHLVIDYGQPLVRFVSLSAEK